MTEAQNDAGEQFDVPRMAAAIERAIGEGKALDEVTRAVFDEVECFSGRHDDDWTMLLVMRTTPLSPQHGSVPGAPSAPMRT